MFERLGWAGAALALLLNGTVGFALESRDFDGLKDEIQQLRKRLAERRQARPSASAGTIRRVERLVSNQYGPHLAATTRTGRLRVQGLVQLWWYTIQNDRQDFDAFLGTSNELFDNDSFRVRRAELKFSLNLTPEIIAVIMLDPTGGDEANTFPGIPTNQGVVGKSAIGGTGELDLNLLNAFLANGNFGLRAQQDVRSGRVRENRVLQDAYINYHSPVIPHHDFTLGQFKPPIGEEGNRNSGQLDFAERAMVSQFSNQRDLGVMVHGTWWQNRFQYWIGGFDTGASFQNTFASFQNRSDDNDGKDLAFKLLLRPLWNREKGGRLEFGYSRQDGIHGESGRGFVLVPGSPPSAAASVDGLSLQSFHAQRQYAWLWYRPAGPVRGWWLRGEWGQIKDRPQPGLGAFVGAQLQPKVFQRDGWYFATGYRLAQSIWAEGLKGGGAFGRFLHDLEFAYRYEVFGNIITDDEATLNASGLTNRTNVFKTQVHTAGLNIYWKGYQIRTQLNFLWVDEPQGHAVGGRRGIREVKNNVFLINQQVQW